LGAGALVPGALVRLAVASDVRVSVLPAVRLGDGLLFPAALVRLAVASGVRLSVLAAVRLAGGSDGQLLSCVWRSRRQCTFRCWRRCGWGRRSCFRLLWCGWRSRRTCAC